MWIKNCTPGSLRIKMESTFFVEPEVWHAVGSSSNSSNLANGDVGNNGEGQQQQQQQQQEQQCIRVCESRIYFELTDEAGETHRWEGTYPASGIFLVRGPGRVEFMFFQPLNR